MTVPFICVAVAFLLIFVPRLFAVAAQAKQPEGFDNKHPREQQARLPDWGKRAVAAHMNAFEDFAPFAASVVVAHLAQADARWSAILAVAHVALRLVYTALYLANLDRLRTTVWMCGFGTTCALFAVGFFRT
jgi:uncharacterized MAPEG superfamily protein